MAGCDVTASAGPSTAKILPFRAVPMVSFEGPVVLTARLVDALSYDRAGGKRRFVWDARIVGLGVRITPSGHKAYVVRYRVNGRQRLATLGACTTARLGRRTEGRTRGPRQGRHRSGPPV
jgi:hypothetical protein